MLDFNVWLISYRGGGLAKMSGMNCVTEILFLIFPEKPATITLKGKTLIAVNTHGHPKRPSLINSLFLVGGRVGFDLFRKKKKTEK